MSIRRRDFLKLGCGASLAVWLGCDGHLARLLPPDEADVSEVAGLRRLARLAHITDTHIVDEESPARFAGAEGLVGHSAWRPYETYSTQLVDGIVRAVNRQHAAGRTFDFLLHTGDVCDNAQGNELEWARVLLAGGEVNPLSGRDDRDVADRPPTHLDPHVAFTAAGLYQNGVHGDGATIDAYVVPGNHDVYGLGVFPIVRQDDGRRVTPLPVRMRPGWVLPVELDPTATGAYGRVTPEDSGPPAFLETPETVTPNADRAYFARSAFHEQLGVAPAHPAVAGCYSVSPIVGVRLIGLDTTRRASEIPTWVYVEGALTPVALQFLDDELSMADKRGELAIVATHHPSDALDLLAGSQVLPRAFRNVLRSHTSMTVHLCGHRHRNRVTDWGGYLEIETCSTLDWPQEGRIVELWRDERDGSVYVGYQMCSHLDETWPPLGGDPLRTLRAAAHDLATRHKNDVGERSALPPEVDPRAAGSAADRQGWHAL